MYGLHSTAGDLSLGHWHLEPTVIGGLLALAVVYAEAMRRRDKAESVRWWQPLCFGLGLLTIFLALASPLDAGADDRLLTLHMVQHALLGTIAPPLLVLGLPEFMARRLSQLPLVGRLLLLAHPVSAGVIFIANMWFWHIPPIYDSAVDNLAPHIAMHLAFMSAGIVFWWPLIQRWPASIRTSDGLKMVYLLATGHPMVLLAALFFASSGVIYSHYDGADRLWGLSAIEDQQIAGLVMGALGETAGFIAFSYLFLRIMEGADDDDEVASDIRPNAASSNPH